MPTHTFNEVMQEIYDISTNVQGCNRSLQTLGVNVATDASISDLSTNIGLIDASTHPDISLPWVMADGSSGFVMPITVNKNRNVQVKAALVPAPNDSAYIAGMMRSTGAAWGLNQMTAGMRARLRLDATPGTSADANNYSGANNVWTDSDSPYYQPMNFAMSKYDTTSYRCSLYNGNSWVHAGSNSAQASTSAFNNFPFGVFAAPYITQNSLTFPRSGYCAPKGTMLYNVVVSSGKYDSSTSAATYEPVLHWDSSFGRYRPSLYDSANKNYSSFPLDDIVDTGADHMYYIDRSIGLEAASGSDVTEEINISTDIYNNPNYTYYVRFNVYKYNGEQMILWTDKDTSSTRITYKSHDIYGYGAETLLTFYENYSNYSSSSNFVYLYNESSSYVQRCNLAVSWNMSTNTNNVSKEPISVNTTNLFWGKTKYSCAKNSLSDRGTFRFGYSQYNFIYWFMAMNENNEIVNYLVPCIYNQNLVLYDVITKTIYTA